MTYLFSKICSDSANSDKHFKNPINKGSSQTQSSLDAEIWLDFLAKINSLNRGIIRRMPPTNFPFILCVNLVIQRNNRLINPIPRSPPPKEKQQNSTQTNQTKEVFHPESVFMSQLNKVYLGMKMISSFWLLYVYSLKRKNKAKGIAPVQQQHSSSTIKESFLYLINAEDHLELAMSF